MGSARWEPAKTNNWITMAMARLSFMRTPLKLLATGAVTVLGLALGSAAHAVTIDGVSFNPGMVFAVTSFYQNAPTAVGQQLQAVGRIDEIGNNPNFCSGCELTFYAPNFTLASATVDPATGIL